MRILIVDGSEDSRDFLESILRSAGYEDVVGTGSTTEAINILESKDGDDEPHPQVDLILLDPGPGNAGAVEAIRNLTGPPALEDAPILLAAGDETGLEEALQAGAFDYFTKPHHPTELMARVRSALRYKHEFDRHKSRERELQTLNRALDRLSKLDRTTGAANRRFFEETFYEEWARARRDRVPLALLVIDLDFFKSYNDVLGSAAGDECLRLVARTIRRSLKRPGDFLARFASDEFTVILPHTDLVGAAAIAEKIRRIIVMQDIRHETAGIDGLLTVSIGAAVAMVDEVKDPRALVAAAERALDEAKASGGNRVSASPVDFAA